jgi:hypothetical protein
MELKRVVLPALVFPMMPIRMVIVGLSVIPNEVLLIVEELTGHPRPLTAAPGPLEDLMELETN